MTASLPAFRLPPGCTVSKEAIRVFVLLGFGFVVMFSALKTENYDSAHDNDHTTNHRSIAPETTMFDAEKTQCVDHNSCTHAHQTQPSCFLFFLLESSDRIPLL
jgi:ABC-type nickel/cobalt efflux system permease component RcnA